jgi:predicted Fe-Mo cluster-binding NifX family protein
MSCYFRHLKEIFNEAGIEVTSANRKKIKEAIHKLTGVDDKDCPAAWKKLKQQVLNDEKNRSEFVRKLRAEVNKRS